MIVVDASVVVDAIVSGSPPVVETLARSSELHAGQHLLAEVMSALRTGARRGRIDVTSETIALLGTIGVRLHPVRPLLGRVWELRDNLTPYDAWYVALAEALELPLVTLDRRIADAPGPRCEVIVPGE